MASQPQNQEAPSLVSGHLKYAQGAVASTFGYESGERTKQSGLQEMRDANAQDTSAPMQLGVLGTVENLAGKATGCDGMEKEGEARKPTAGVEEQSGTG